MSYDPQTVTAILEMASTHARAHLLRSAIDKRDYAFMEVVFAASGIAPFNTLTKDGATGLGMFGDRSSIHPVDLAVTENDPVLLEWLLARDIELNGGWVTEMDSKPYATLNFPALDLAFSLGQEQMARRLLTFVAEKPFYNFIFSKRDSQKEFVLGEGLDLRKPEGMTPLTCALTNGWEEFAGELLAHTECTTEYDLMVALSRRSAHVEAVAAKIEAIPFESFMRKNFHAFNGLDATRKSQYFQLLQRFTPVMKFDDKASGFSFADVVSPNTSVDEARFYLDYPGLDSAFKSRKIDPLHNLLWAASKDGNLELTRWLVEGRGADPDGVVREDLHLRCGYEAPVFGAKGAALMYLAQAGANLNVEDADGMTPLMLATKGNKTARVDELLQAGADSAYKSSKTKQSALQMAKNDDLRALIRSSRTMAAVAKTIGKMDEGVAVKKKTSAAPL